MECSADIDGRYRYRLTRTWSNSLVPLPWVMLNPSTADAFRDDPTIKRCIGFAMNAGYGGIEVYNLFAHRSTHPVHLRVADDPVGPENDRYISAITGTRVVAAWGKLDSCLVPREKAVCELLWKAGKELYCLGMTKDFFPRHPLYVKSGTPLESWIGDGNGNR